MHKTVRSFSYSEGKLSHVWSDLLLETPLEITIGDQPPVIIMFTPDLTRELVFGFMFTEGIINNASDVKEITIKHTETERRGKVIEALVKISNHLSITPKPTRKTISYSSCGICGKESYYAFESWMSRVKSRHRFKMGLLIELPDRLENCQPLYKRTGGAHAAVVFDDEGTAILNSEDMGRHNALDKVIGAALLREISCEDKILVSSGRASLEMIVKAARAGFPVFVAMSRPTSKAVEAAKFYNITLVDMAKNTNRIYTHARRIEDFSGLQHSALAE